MSAATDSKTPSFVPALGHDHLTPFYDVVAWLFGDTAMKRRLIEQAAIAPGHDVLDLGCGTGTLVLMIKDTHPGAHVSGVDIDPKILALARGKAATAGVDVTLVEGSATAPPLPPASFDRVLSSLVLHHLTTPQKRQALAAARRLLRPGGELHVADWGKPQNLLMRIAALGFQFSDGSETTEANVRGELPSLIAAAGFRDVAETEHHMTIFGTLTYLRAIADS
jgi:ubiquinone/menaquinone biosynthesis C-methylase UbiE